MFDVWPENWETVQLFLAVQTQWRMAPMGGVVGLDYAAVDAAIRHLRRPMTPELFAGLQIMEKAAIAELNRDRGERSG